MWGWFIFRVKLQLQWSRCVSTSFIFSFNLISLHSLFFMFSIGRYDRTFVWGFKGDPFICSSNIQLISHTRRQQIRYYRLRIGYFCPARRNQLSFRIQFRGFASEYSAGTRIAVSITRQLIPGNYCWDWFTQPARAWQADQARRVHLPPTSSSATTAGPLISRNMALATFMSYCFENSFQDVSSRDAHQRIKIPANICKSKWPQ